jgi:hypothetical protein
MPTKTNDTEEADFQSWYKSHAEKLKINPNPDDRLHFYDYRSAYKEGSGPDKEGHWPSKYKSKEHPRRVLNGIDTATGKKVDHQDYTGPLRSFDDHFDEAVRGRK